MERMTENEKRKLAELQAKQKRVARAEELFFKECDSMKKEILERFNRADRMQKAAEVIGTTPEVLYAWVTSEEVIDLFRSTHDEAEMTRTQSEEGEASA